MIKINAVVALVIGSCVLEACSSKGPCPAFEGQDDIEQKLIVRAKDRMLAKLVQNNSIESTDEIIFFDDCCSIGKVETETLLEQAFGETFQYHIGISHHKSDVDRNVTKYSYSSILGRCGDLIGDGVDIKENQNEFVSDLQKKFDKQINLEKFEN